MRRSTASRSSGIRRSLVGLAASLAVVALTGCSVLTTFLPTSGAAKPVVGDCWTSTFTTAQQASTWTGGPASCTAAHQLYTYGVVSVKSSASSWADGGGTLSNDIATAADDACGTAFDRFIPETLPVGSRLDRYFFLPSESAWKAGARWVRCDIGVLKAGSLYEDPTFSTLPTPISKLTALVKSTPDLFADCVTTTDSSGDTGPYDDPKATIADCTGDYQWMLHSIFDIEAAADGSVPSDDALNPVLQAKCGDDADSAGVDWIVYLPSDDQWTAGDRSVECWFLASGSGTGDHVNA